jgi:hypothetical protein
MKLLLTILCICIINLLQAQNRVFFGNLHSPTSYSDGSATPKDAYKYARDVAKIDFLAITEHNHRSASRIADNPALYSGSASTSLISTARRFTEDNRFVAIYGQEFSSISSGNHCNILEINEVIDAAAVPNGRWDKLMKEWLPTHRDPQGRLPIMLLNPATSSSPNAIEYGRDDFSDFDSWITTLDDCAKLINIINGPSHEENDPPVRPSESEFLRYLSMGLHAAPTADQDNHKKNWGNAANTRTAVIAASLTKTNIMDALRSRKVYATEDKNLSVIATINDNLIGSVITGNNVPVVNSPLVIKLDVIDADEPQAFYTVDVYRGNIGDLQHADVIQEIEFEGNREITINNLQYTGGRQYFFLKISQTDDDGIEIDHAWLAPVWFEPGMPGAPGSPNTSMILTLTVNERTEIATITNIGNAPVDLSSWVLESTVGEQRFTIQPNNIVQPGNSLLITSGPNAVTDGNKITWTTSYIWSNAGDPAKLFDTTGRLIASSSH